MGNFEKYLRFANDLTNGTHSRFRTKAELAEFAGIAPSQVKKYQTASDMKNIEKFFAFLDKLGVNLDFEPNPEPDRDVCFVNARIAPIGADIEPPQSEDYIAAPMVGEVGAGLGYIPQDEVKSWFLAYRHHPAVRFRRNLIAVEIGAHSTSMQPTLNPGDIAPRPYDAGDGSRRGRDDQARVHRGQAGRGLPHHLLQRQRPQAPAYGLQPAQGLLRGLGQGDCRPCDLGMDGCAGEVGVWGDK